MDFLEIINLYKLLGKNEEKVLLYHKNYIEN